jgi:hypothetical protein
MTVKQFQCPKMCIILLAERLPCDFPHIISLANQLLKKTPFATQFFVLHLSPYKIQFFLHLFVHQRAGVACFKFGTIRDAICIFGVASY